MVNMGELSNIVFYFLSTVAQVCATILGFFIVGQIYIYGMMEKVSEKNKEPVKAGEKLCITIVVPPQVKNIYITLIVIIFLSILGILFNFESFGIYVLIIPIIVLILFILVLYILYNYIINLIKYVPRLHERIEKRRIL